MDNLEWLGDWYQRQCDGEWEHSSGIRLDTVEEEPHGAGWHLTIHLRGTSAEQLNAQQLKLDATGGEWLHCAVAEGRFDGSGDTRKLEQIIGVFRQWVDRPQP